MVTTRRGKGSQLTWDEMDDNLTELESAIDSLGADAAAIQAVINASFASDEFREAVINIINENQGGGTTLSVTTQPVIQVQGGGEPIEGAVLELATAAAFGGTPDSTSHAWLRSSVAIGGATSSTYTITAGDVTDGGPITYTSTAVKAGQTSVVAVSTNSITPVLDDFVLVNTVAPAYTSGPTSPIATALDPGAANASRYVSFTGPTLTTGAAFIRVKLSNSSAGADQMLVATGKPLNTLPGLNLGLRYDGGGTTVEPFAILRFTGSTTEWQTNLAPIAFDNAEYILGVVWNTTNAGWFWAKEGDTSVTLRDWAAHGLGTGGVPTDTWTLGRDAWTTSYVLNPFGNFAMYDSVVNEATVLAALTSDWHAARATNLLWHLRMRDTTETTNLGSAGGTCTYNGSSWSTTTQFFAGSLTAGPSDTLTASAGTYTVNGVATVPDNLSYQWTLDNADITNATSASYAVPAAAVYGSAYRRRTTASDNTPLGTTNVITHTTDPVYIVEGAAAEAQPLAYQVKGNWITIQDSQSLGVSGLSDINGFLGIANIQYIVGLLILIDWRSVEPSDGGYSWSRLDDMVNAVSNSGRKFMIQIVERNYHQYCSTSTTVPSFIPTETGAGTTNAVRCMAKIWETATMDQYIAVHKAVIDRYSSNSNFLGFMLEEISAGTASLLNNNGWQTLMKPQWIRMHQAIAAYAPNVILGNNLGWAPLADTEDIANALDSYNGGMLSWPDTFLPGETYHSAAVGTTYGWYTTAINRNDTMIIMPQVQTSFMSGPTLQDHKDRYVYLRDTIGATAIIWDHYHGGAASNVDYMTNYVVAAVNFYSGVLNPPVAP